MQEMLIQIFSNPKLNDLIQKTSQENQFSEEEDISLKSLLLTVFLLTRKEEDIYKYFKMIESGILKNRSQNQFGSILNQILEEEMKENDFQKAEQFVQNLIFDGYCFHSFNQAFLKTIQERGLVVQNKPWDNEEIDNIREKFRQNGIDSVFGLYQGRKETPIFFASTLQSSRFYAYSSPTWYRHFVSGGMKSNPTEYDKNAFFYRDYEHALENVLKMCRKGNLSEEERIHILDFFNRYWNILATHDLPCVALIKRTDIVTDEIRLKPLENETALSYLKRLIVYYGGINHIVKNDIEKEKLIIFPYELEKIALVQPKKEHSL